MVNLCANEAHDKNMTKLMIFSHLIWLIKKFGISLHDISTNSF